MNQAEIRAIQNYQQNVHPIVHEPKTKKEFNKLVSFWEELLIIIGEDENHKLVGLLDCVSNFIESYNKKHFPPAKSTATGVGTLKLLMESNNLHQKDLPEIGSQGVVSEILSGKRKLNLRQIKLLAKRFNITPNTFIN